MQRAIPKLRLNLSPLCNLHVKMMHGSCCNRVTGRGRSAAALFFYLPLPSSQLKWGEKEPCVWSEMEAASPPAAAAVGDVGKGLSLGPGRRESGFMSLSDIKLQKQTFPPDCIHTQAAGSMKGVLCFLYCAGSFTKGGPWMKKPHVLMPKSHVGECDEHWRSVVVDAEDTVCV